MKRIAAVLLILLTSCSFSCPVSAMPPKETKTLICLDREYNFRAREEYLSVCSSSDHSAMIRPDGSLWMFGGNYEGQLGIGDIRYSYNAPIKVMENVEKVKLNDDITIVKKRDGSVWGFGRDIASTPKKLLQNAVDAAADVGALGYITSDGRAYLAPIGGAGRLDIAENAEEIFVEYNELEGQGFSQDSSEGAPAGQAFYYFVIIKHKDGTVCEYAVDENDKVTRRLLAEDVRDVSLNTSTAAYLTIVKKDGTVMYGTARGGLKSVNVPGCKEALASPEGLFVLKDNKTLWNIDKNLQYGEKVKLFSLPQARTAFMIYTNNSIELGSTVRADIDAFNAINRAGIKCYNMPMYDDIYKKTMEIVGNETDKYVQAKLVCQWIVDRITYEFSDHDQSGVEGFRQGTGVCAAYSNLAQIMLSYLDIPIADINGERHAWNIAIIDGVAVFIDLTNADYNPIGYMFDYPALTSAKTMCSNTYRETPYDDWAATEIRGAYDYGIIDEPLNSDMRTPINRLQFCSLVRAVIEQAKGKDIDKLISELGKSSVPVSFKDTTNKDVAALCRLGIINGTSETTFAPKDNLTREQAAKIMRGLAETLGQDVSAPTPRFSDSKKISTWAIPGVSFVAHNGIMKGKTNGFAPLDTLTTQEAIILCFRYFGNVKQ